MSANKGNVVLIKAGDCGHCVRLTPQLPDIKKKLNKNGYDLIVYEVPKMWIKGSYPEVLDMPGWYPFMLYADKGTWEEIVKGKDLRSKLHICNGTYDAGSKRYNLTQPIKYGGGIEGILQWLGDVSNSPIIREIPPSSTSSSNVKPAARIAAKEEGAPQIINIVHRKKYGRKERRKR